MTAETWTQPDPFYQPEFYSDVPVKRLVAWLIDTVIIIALVLLALPFTAFTGIFFLPVLFLGISFAYRVVTIANGSATLGMRLVAIEFLDGCGRRFGAPEAFAHTLGYTISWAFPIAQFISVIFMASHERGQGLTDMVMGSVAINRRAR